MREGRLEYGLSEGTLSQMAGHPEPVENANDPAEATRLEGRKTV